jgi:hypothetical protein
VNIEALKVASPMVAKLEAEGNTGMQQTDQLVHLMPTPAAQNMDPNALVAEGKAEEAHSLVKQQEGQWVHMNFAAVVDQQATNQSSWSRQGWGSIAPSLSQVGTLGSAREALRRSSLEQLVLPVPAHQQREELLLLG